MSVESHRVLIGAYGWKHPAWNYDFYDEDLPEDWQLGFYANEFPVVYVPASDWLEQADLAEWEEEVTESFRFILDVPCEVINDVSQLTKALKKAQKEKIYEKKRILSKDRMCICWTCCNTCDTEAGGC